MLEVVQKAVNNELSHISSLESDLFKGHASNNERLLHFDWQTTGQKLQCQAPYLYSIFSKSISLNPKKNVSCMLTSLCVLLYGRSQKLSLLQYILGLTLDKCGLTKVMK